MNLDFHSERFITNLLVIMTASLERDIFREFNPQASTFRFIFKAHRATPQVHPQHG